MAYSCVLFDMTVYGPQYTGTPAILRRLEVLFGVGQAAPIAYSLDLSGLTEAAANSLLYEADGITPRPYVRPGTPNTGQSEPLVRWASDGTGPHWKLDDKGQGGTVAFPITDTIWNAIWAEFLSGNPVNLRLIGSAPAQYSKFEFALGTDLDQRTNNIFELNSANPSLFPLEINGDFYIGTPALIEPVLPGLPPTDLVWGLDRAALQKRRLLFSQATQGVSGSYTQTVLLGDPTTPQAEVDELYLERMHIPFPNGDRMDWESVKQVSYVAPKCRRANPEFYIDLWLGTQDDLDSPIRWHGPKRWRPGKKGVFFDKSGRFISLRARVPSDIDFRLTGYDIEYKLVSKR